MPAFPQRSRTTLLAAACFASLLPTVRGDEPNYSRAEDVVYGRKHGMALTLDVFRPKEKANGAGIIWVVSGGWFSAHEAISPAFIQEFLNRGYTVFAVVHGSQPRFTIPEIVADMKRAVRFIRTNAKTYDVDPDRLGIMGGSAGGHLSLMIGTSGEAEKPEVKDAVDRASSRVQAVACFFPPTDFLNYGKEGENALGRGVLRGFQPPFDFQERDPKTNIYRPITDEAKILEIGRDISPVNHVTKDDPPTLIIHGDADQLVPIQQAHLIIDRLEKAGVKAKLITKPGASHGWPDLLKDQALLADWFDEEIGKPRSKSE